MPPGISADDLINGDLNRILIVVLVTSVPTILGLLALIIRFVIESRKRKEEMEQVKANAQTAIDKLREETEIALRKEREEADQRQKGAQLGVVSQLADQVQTVLSSNDRTVRLLEQQVAQVSELVHQKEVLIGVIDRQSETSKQQAGAITVQYDSITQGQKDLTKVLEDSIAALQRNINQDFKAWIDGLRADGEFSAALNALREIPLRMDRADRTITDISGRVNRMPKEIAAELKTELEGLRVHIDSVVLRLQEVQNGQSITDGGSQTVIEVAAQPTIYPAGIDSVTILRDPADKPV